jgi:hypothetical protein
MSGLGRFFPSFRKPKPSTPETYPVPLPTPPTSNETGKPAAIWYGDLVNFYGAKSRAEVMAKMREFKLVVFPWDCCLNSPGEWQRDTASSIIAEFKSSLSSPSRPLIAGYVFIGQAEKKEVMSDSGELIDRISHDTLRAKIGTWKEMGADLIFIDQFGDQDSYKTTEADQLVAMNSAHSLGMPVIMNAWKVSEIYRPGKKLPIWEDRDIYMFENMGENPDADEAKLGDWVNENIGRALTFGTGFRKYRNDRTDKLAKRLNYFGWTYSDESYH